MQSRSAEVFRCSKQLFPFQFLPKTAYFNFSETGYFVFAIKKVLFFFFIFYDHVLGQPTEAFWQEVSDGYVKNYVWHWFLDALASLDLLIADSLTHSEIGNWQFNTASVLIIEIEIVTE